MRLIRLSTVVLFAVVAATGSVDAGEWYVSPKGTVQGTGSRESPWDLESALLGKRDVKAGDTLYLLEGTYRGRPDEKFVVKLVGADGKPIHVRPAPKERAIIDGGLAVQNPSAHVWVRDLEILVSEPQPEKPVSAGSFPGDFKRPWGGLNVDGGKDCKYIHLVIHECRQGISLWSAAVDTEVYGCIIYDNGWPAVDRGHGHAIYTQTKDGVTAIRDCIMTGGHGFTMHAYGSKNAYVDNYVIEGNIAYNANTFLVGGGRPSKNIRVRGNYLFGLPMQIGYTAPYNEDCEVQGNVIVNGGLSINKYKKVVNEDNLVLDKKDARPREARVIVRPSKYEPARAHLALFNWDKQPTVNVDAGTLLKNGDRYRLLNPRDPFGKAVQTGTYDGNPIRVPVQGEFAAYVLLREPQ
jgi:hypothetical protein